MYNKRGNFAIHTRGDMSTAVSDGGNSVELRLHQRFRTGHVNDFQQQHFKQRFFYRTIAQIN